MRKTFLLILVFLFFVAQAQSADQVDFPDIYIDADAGDTGVGSQADPYNEFSDINWTTGGDNSVFDYYAGSETASVTINLQKGDTWREQLTVSVSGSASYPIIIRSYGTGADPIIDGADDITTSGWSDQGGNVWRYNIGDDDPELVWFDGSLGTLDATPDSFGEWTYSDPNLDVYATDDPDNGVYYSSIEAKVRLYGVLVHDASYIDVENIVARRTRSANFRVLETADSTITQFTFDNVEGSYGSIGFWARSDYVTGVVSYIEVKNSSFHHCGSGIYTSRVYNSLFHHNESHTNGRTYRPNAEEYGIAHNTGHDNEFYANTVYNNEGNGIHIYGEPPSELTLRNKVYDNHFYNNGTDPDYIDGAAVRIAGSLYVTDTAGTLDLTEVYRNKIESDLVGIYLKGTRSKIYNNLILTSSSTDAGILLVGHGDDAGSQLFNNTIYGYGIGISAVPLSSNPSDYDGLETKNNIIDSCTVGLNRVFPGDWDYNLLNNTTNIQWRLGGTKFWINPVSGNSFLREGNSDLSFLAGGPPYQIALIDDSGETLVGYVGESDSAKTLGSEAINDAENYDFSTGTIGDWIPIDDCTDASVTYDTTDLGGPDNKQGKITVDETTDPCGFVYAYLPTSRMTLSTRRMYEFSTKLYVPTANTNYDVIIRTSTLDGDRPDQITTTLTPDTWTTVTLNGYWHDDIVGSILIGFSPEIGAEDGDVIYYDDISVKPMLTAGTDAVRIYSTSDLLTEGWVDSGTNFDFTDREYDVAFSPVLSSNDVSGDPLFADSGSYDFSLLSESAAINAGVDLGDSYDDGLNPTSTWPDGVLTIDQDDYGNWDIGAYVWPGILRPMGVRIIGGCVF